MFLDILVGLTQTFLETLLVIIAATNTPLILDVLLISIDTCPMFRLIQAGHNLERHSLNAGYAQAVQSSTYPEIHF